MRAPHSGGGIEGSTQMGSVQTAAEALQKAETEVVTAETSKRDGSRAVRRSTNTVIDFGLLA
jgi:predicted NAD/FAD-dependent oxidoreductase